MDDFVNQTGTRLRRARLDAGYRTASAAAKKLGIPISTYTAHENNQNDFSPEQAEEYAKAFNTSAEWLLFERRPVADKTPGIDDKLVDLKKLDEDAFQKLRNRFLDMIEGAKTLLKTK